LILTDRILKTKFRIYRLPVLMSQRIFLKP